MPCTSSTGQTDAHVVAADHQQPLVRRAAALAARPRRLVPRRAACRATRRPAARRGRWPGRARRRSAGAAASESGAGSATSVTTGGRQREPLGADAEDRRPTACRARRPRFGCAKWLGPARRGSRPARRASSSAAAAGGVDRAVAAVHVLLQLRARGVAAHADRVPAIVDDGVDGPARQASLMSALRCCSSRRARLRSTCAPARVALLLHQQRQVDQRVVVMRDRDRAPCGSSAAASAGSRSASRTRPSR